MALMHALSRHAHRFGLSLAAHGVDHGLRAEAPAELDLAQALAQQLEIPFSRERVHVPAGGNLQAQARAARRASLERAAQAAGAAAIATAHHADDRAETVLMRLMRGAGPRGLAALPPRCDLWIRPLLRARRADIQAHLARHGLVFASDPSNDDPRFLRVRVRFELLPLLERLSPQIVLHLCALSDALLPEARASEPFLSSLSRAQRLQLERAMRLAQMTAGVRLSAGRELRLDPATLEPLITRAAEPRARRSQAR
jgi:tRNA(Ile)-lysidine synthase